MTKPTNLNSDSGQDPLLIEFKALITKLGEDVAVNSTYESTERMISAMKSSLNQLERKIDSLCSSLEHANKQTSNIYSCQESAQATLIEAKSVVDKTNNASVSAIEARKKLAETINRTTRLHIAHSETIETRMISAENSAKRLRDDFNKLISTTIESTNAIHQSMANSVNVISVESEKALTEFNSSRKKTMLFLFIINILFSAFILSGVWLMIDKN